LAELRQRSRDLEANGGALTWETMRVHVVAKLPPGA